MWCFEIILCQCNQTFIALMDTTDSMLVYLLLPATSNKATAYISAVWEASH